MDHLRGRFHFCPFCKQRYIRIREHLRNSCMQNELEDIDDVIKEMSAREAVILENQTIFKSEILNWRGRTEKIIEDLTEKGFFIVDDVVDIEIEHENLEQFNENSKRYFGFNRQRRIKKSIKFCTSPTPSPDGQRRDEREDVANFVEEQNFNDEQQFDENENYHELEFNENEAEENEDEEPFVEEEEENREEIPKARHIRFADLPTHTRFNDSDDENNEQEKREGEIVAENPAPPTAPLSTDLSSPPSSTTSSSSNFSSPSSPSVSLRSSSSSTTQSSDDSSPTSAAEKSSPSLIISPVPSRSSCSSTTQSSDDSSPTSAAEKSSASSPSLFPPASSVSSESEEANSGRRKLRPRAPAQRIFSDAELKEKCADQRWTDVVVRQTSNVGRGVFAAKNIAKNSIVANYKGELKKNRLLEKQLGSLSAEESAKIEEYQLDFVYDGTKYSVDASAENNSIGRLINHCRWHANIKPVTKRFADGVIEVLFVAKREINDGEQLVFDYGPRYDRAVFNNCPCHDEQHPSSSLSNAN